MRRRVPPGGRKPEKRRGKRTGEADNQNIETKKLKKSFDIPADFR
jgi:hypothetical protein